MNPALSRFPEGPRRDSKSPGEVQGACKAHELQLGATERGIPGENSQRPPQEQPNRAQLLSAPLLDLLPRKTLLGVQL
jgi:hypothetical protein